MAKKSGSPPRTLAGEIIAQGTVWFNQENDFFELQLPEMNNLLLRFTYARLSDEELEIMRSEGSPVRVSASPNHDTVMVDWKLIKSAPASVFTREVFAFQTGVRQKFVTMDLKAKSWPLSGGKLAGGRMIEMSYSIAYREEEVEE